VVLDSICISLTDNGVYVDTEKIPLNVKQAISELQAATVHCTALTVNICLSYGARGEITAACKSICEQARQGSLNPDDITEQMFGAELSTKTFSGNRCLYTVSSVFVAYRF
jgi:undecaprenyl diphosphate synthase